MHKKILSRFYFVPDYDKDYIKDIDKKINIIVRSYDKPINLKKLKEFRNFCKLNNYQIFLSNNLKIALNLKFDGIYIPSFNRKINFLLNKNTKNLKVIGSAHSIKEIKIKEKQGVDVLFISPLFNLKKSNQFLEVLKFNLLTQTTSKKIIALGGINQSNIKKLNLLKIEGFAGISYFQKKTAL
jgi:thiamine-phosphate pyrophosphorylase|tara:strand:+ start:126 stop:674 length:549 start_codon:yes stop_codon:yes gene_type:complete